ncbi:MAG: phosphatase PAP2 family protein, partial [Promethearchaeota archaeon]
NFVKMRVNRTRPCHELEGVELRTSTQFFKGSSFPSGHTHYFFSNMLLLTAAISNANPPSFPFMLCLTIVLACIVGLSRIYVGVHYPTDVIFAFLFGLFSFAFTWYVLYPLIFSKIFIFLARLILA